MSIVPSPTLSDKARLWIYQSDRLLDDTEIRMIEAQAHNFVQSWTSHNRNLVAHAEVHHKLFLVLMIDETNAEASGCAIDKSVYFMESLGQMYGIDWFNRMNFTYLDGKTVKIAPRNAFAELYKKGEINDNTLVFNNLINNVSELSTKWIVPLKDSWHKRMV